MHNVQAGYAGYDQILLIPQEGEKLAVKADVKSLLQAGGIPSFIKTWKSIKPSKGGSVAEDNC
jgi:hypothetical protein